MLPSIVRILASIFETSAVVILALSLFRITLAYNYYKVLIISILISCSTFYLYNIANLASFIAPSYLIIFIFSIMFFFNLPFIYSVLISFIGFFIAAIMEYAVSLLLLMTGYFNVQDHFQAGLLYVLTGILLFIIVYFLQTRKIGFMFLINHFTIKQAIKPYNYLLYAILIIGFLAIEITAITYYQFSMHFLTLIILTVVCLIGVYIAYRQNKTLLNQRYERLKNR
jgi:hypothetical protein